MWDPRIGNVVQLINNLFRSQTVVRFYFQGNFFLHCNWRSREKTICCLTNNTGGWHGTRRRRAPSDVTLLFIIFLTSAMISYNRYIYISFPSKRLECFGSLLRFAVMHLDIYKSRPSRPPYFT